MGMSGFADDEICYPHTGFNRNALDPHLRVLLYRASGVVFSGETFGALQTSLYKVVSLEIACIYLYKI